MEPRPRGLLTAEAQLALQPQRTDAGLLTGHRPDRPEPDRQGRPDILEDGPSGDRRLVPAGAALHQAPIIAPATPCAVRTEDTGIPLATAAGSDTRGRLPRSQTAARTRRDPEGNRPRARTLYVGVT